MDDKDTGRFSDPSVNATRCIVTELSRPVSLSSSGGLLSEVGSYTVNTKP